MSRIRIRNFGPIKEGFLENDGWIYINKITTFIGNQGSGKSTVAKLISTFIWMEKALVRGDFGIISYEKKGKFKENFLKYHRIENYLFEDTEIQYQGETHEIIYKNESVQITEFKTTKYPLPQIIYVPAERNLLAYVSSIKELKLISDSLKDFLTELDNAKRDINAFVSLPINDAKVVHNSLYDDLSIRGDNYSLTLSQSSSGFQSLVPLFLVSKYLSKSVGLQSKSSKSMSIQESNDFRNKMELILNNESLTEEQKRISVSIISSKFNKTAFINIVEEPEQNLFPTSQWQMLRTLLEFNNDSPGNKLIMTTHSPYLINYLSIAIQAGYLKSKNLSKNLSKKLYNIVPLKSIINADEVAIYQFDEIKGTISKLSDYEGIPSDENYLNQKLQEGNALFDLLLEIEEEL